MLFGLPKHRHLRENVAPQRTPTQHRFTGHHVHPEKAGTQTLKPVKNLTQTTRKGKQTAQTTETQGH